MAHVVSTMCSGGGFVNFADVFITLLNLQSRTEALAVAKINVCFGSSHYCGVSQMDLF